jgi:hypothetical protein
VLKEQRACCRRRDLRPVRARGACAALCPSALTACGHYRRSTAAGDFPGGGVGRVAALGGCIVRGRADSRWDCRRARLHGWARGTECGCVTRSPCRHRHGVLHRGTSRLGGAGPDYRRSVWHAGHARCDDGCHHGNRGNFRTGADPCAPVANWRYRPGRSRTAPAAAITGTCAGRSLDSRASSLIAGSGHDEPPAPTRASSPRRRRLRPPREVRRTPEGGRTQSGGRGVPMPRS